MKREIDIHEFLGDTRISDAASCDRRHTESTPLAYGDIAVATTPAAKRNAVPRIACNDISRPALAALASAFQDVVALPLRRRFVAPATIAVEPDIAAFANGETPRFAFMHKPGLLRDAHVTAPL